MASRFSRIHNLSPIQLVASLREHPRKVKIIDCRSFLEYNDNHVVGAVNICCSKLIKRRLQQEKISIRDLLLHCHIEVDESSEICVYDQRSESVEEVCFDSFVHVLLKKLVQVFDNVHFLAGGFIGFQTLYPEFTENKIWKYPGLTALSQPCLPASSPGPTRILPFLYLGSEEDANNRELLQSHNITYELNVSNKCPKPDFISDGHFMRIPVNDSHNEKLLPHFYDAFSFVDKARESNESVLIHCLAGISRSPTVAIAYVMRHLQMTCEEAYRYVKAKRATISPNFNFLGQLLEYEKQLIQEKVVEKIPQTQQSSSSFSSSSSSCSQSLDFVLGPPPTLPTPVLAGNPSAKRLNLSLRLSTFAESPTLSSPKDSSPTTALAKLQFDKPLGKENRTGCSATTPPGSLAFVGLSRPTRLVKEQNVASIQEEEVGQWDSVSRSVMHHSVSISISKGFKCRKSSVDQQLTESSSSKFQGASPCGRTDYGKKLRVHRIHIEGTDDSKEKPTESRGEGSTTSACPSSISAVSLADEPCSGPPCLSPLASLKREFSRSDSVSTSGIGSEISENELQASGSWEVSESGNYCDDGVFSESYSGSSKSPRRHLQLWSSDSGHWSSTDEGLSCSTSQVMDIPLESDVALSPEKRKCPSSLFPDLGNSSLDKRKSYAGDSSTTLPTESKSDIRRPKRWSISEDIGKLDSGSPQSEVSELNAEGDENEESATSKPNNASQSDPDNHWFNLISGSELTCCERQGEGLLYRVHSCPGFLGCRDWLQMQQTVPDSPPEPISDSVLLKMRSCCHRSRYERSYEHSTAPQSHHHPWSRNRFSFGQADYEELLAKLQNVQDSKAESSSHSSSSTLASSSFSIVVQ